jgi:hypothetical protein
MYAKVLENHSRSIAYKEALRRFKAGNHELHNVGTTENGFQPSLSIRNIAKLLNVSEKKAMDIIRNCNRLKIIRTIKQSPQCIGSDSQGFNPDYFNDYPGHWFRYKGKIYRQFGSKHLFLEYPISIPRISSKHYIDTYRSNHK